MKYKKTILIDNNLSERINKYLTVEPENESECLNENTTITHTVSFSDDTEVDIKCCGVQYKENESNLAWTEAVLVKNGSVVAFTDPQDEYLGLWKIEYDNNTYIVDVKTTDDITSILITPNSILITLNNGETISSDCEKENFDKITKIITQPTKPTFKVGDHVRIKPNCNKYKNYMPQLSRYPAVIIDVDQDLITVNVHGVRNISNARGYFYFTSDDLIKKKIYINKSNIERRQNENT